MGNVAHGLDYYLKDRKRLEKLVEDPDNAEIFGDLLQIVEHFGQLETALRVDPMKGFRPNPGPQEDFIRAVTRCVALFLANRAGKTTIGVGKSYACSQGYHPWMDPDDPDYWIRLPWVEGNPKIQVPNVGRICVTDYKSWERDVSREWDRWVPRSEYKLTKNSQGNVTKITMANRSVIYVMTREMDDMAWEGGKIDWAFFNEPCKQAHFIATLRGLMDTNGPYWLCLTLLEEEPWIFDMIWEKGKEDPNITVIEGTALSNTKEQGGILDQAAVDDFAKYLSDDEYAARILGRPMLIGGRIFKQWRSEEPYFIPAVPIRHDWLRVMCIDPHPRKPFALLWGVVDPKSDILYLVHEVRDKSLVTISDLVEKIAWVEQKMPFDIRNADGKVVQGKLGKAHLRWIDPAGTEPSSIDKGDTVQLALHRNGIHCQKWFRGDKSNQIITAQDWLRDREDIGPRTQVFNHCNMFDGEMRHWFTDSKTGKPRKLGNDLIDCWLAMVYKNVLQIGKNYSTEQSTEAVTTKILGRRPIIGRVR